MKLSDVTKKRIRFAYSTVLSLLIVVTGVLFIASCYSIHRSGVHPFTVESVSEAFNRIRIPVYLTLAVLIGSFALHLFLPEKEEKLKPLGINAAVLERMSRRLKWDEISEEQKSKIEKERRFRLILQRILSALILLSAVLPLIYLLNPNHFPAEAGQYNAEILHGLLVYAATLCPLFVYSAVYGILLGRSILRETELIRAAIKTYGVAGGAQEETSVSFLQENRGSILLGARIAILAAAVVFIAVGAASGGAESVLAKAVKICTECIGLG